MKASRFVSEPTARNAAGCHSSKKWDLGNRVLERAGQAPPGSLKVAHARTRGDMDSREKWKWELTRGLYERGYGKKQVLDLFRLIDWLLTLPANLKLSFKRRV